MTKLSRVFWAPALALLLPALSWGQYPSEVVGFNGPPIDDPATSQEMFRIPEWSGSTSSYVIPNTPGSYDNDAAFRASGLQTEGAAAMQVFFYWADPTDPDAWVRLTTFNGPERPNPSLHTEGKVRFYITNRSGLFVGQIGLCLGIRETDVVVPQMEDGGTTGDIEWVGVDTTPNGIVVGDNHIVDTTAVGDDIQEYPVGTNLDDLGLPLGTAVVSVGPNGVLDTTPEGDDEVRFGYFMTAEGERRPIPAITLNPSGTPYFVEWDLATGVVSVNGTPMGGGIAGFTGDGDLSTPHNRGTLEHIAITNVATDTWDGIEFAIDELQFEAPEPDPVVPPTVVAPIIAGDTQVTVTNLLGTADLVRLYRDDVLVDELAATPPDDVVFDITSAPAQTGEAFTATQHDSVTDQWSEPSAPVVVLPEASPYSFSIVIDEDGNDCSFDPPGGWEFTPVTAVDSGPVPYGVNLFNNPGQWVTVDVPLDDDSVVLPWLGGNGMIEPSPTGVYSIDSVWFTIAPGADVGPYEVFIDAVQALDEFGQVIATIHDMEDGVNYLQYPRGQSTTTPSSSQLSTLTSYDGVASHRLEWTYPSTDPGETLGMYHNIGYSCATSPTFPDTTATVRFHLLCRRVSDNPVPMPQVVGPIVGNQDTVRIVNDSAATAVQLYINGEPSGSPVTPTGTETDFTGLVLNPGDSVSATQTLPAGESDLAYPQVLQEKPVPPTVVTPVIPGLNTVEVTDILTAPFATASLVTVYVNGAAHGTAVPTGDTVTVTLDLTLATGDLVSATQTVNGATSDPSPEVEVIFEAPTIFAAPAEGDAYVTVQDLFPGADSVTVVVNGTTEFSDTPDPEMTIWDVPVSGLVAGDVVTAYYTLGGVDSVVSDPETVTVSTVTVVFCDDMESYVDQDDFENDPGEVRDRGWWPSSGDPGLTLVFDKNATPGGSQSAYCPAGQSPPEGGWTDGWQSNFDFTYPEPDWPPLQATATEPIVWSVNIYDAGGAGANNLYQWSELRDYSTGSLGGLIAVGMPGSSFFPDIDNNYYSGRVLFGGPNYINLDHPGAPLRSVGWHTFTVVVKPTTIDFYVDGVLAKKNVPRNEIVYDNLYIGSGYAPNMEGWYDDYCVHNGAVIFRPRVPNAPSVVSPLVEGDEVVTVTNVEPDATLVTVYADGSPIGTAVPTGDSTIDVPVTALQHLQMITASQTTPAGDSEQGPGLEVGKGSGDVLISLGIRETGDTGPLGSEGSTTGEIEWIGASGTVDGAPQGVAISPSPSWQTVVFDPLSDPITGFTGDGLITETRGVLEHLAVAVNAASPDRSTGPYLLYVDNVINVGADTGGGDFLITDFEGYPLDSEVLFQEPGLSGSTSMHVVYPPDFSGVTDEQGNPGQSEFLTWFWRDTTAQRWVRITTSGTPNLSRPIIDLTKPIQMDLLLLEAAGGLIGDLNCDGAVNAFDIDPFILALTDPAGYQAMYPDCDINNADINNDGAVNAFDIDPFIELLTGG